METDIIEYKDNRIPVNTRETIRDLLDEAGAGIIRYLHDDSFWVWRDSKGQKFTTRLSKVLHDQGLKIDSGLLSKIGEIARRAVTDSAPIYYDLTRDFNWEAGDFGDHGSCFWGSRAVAKDIIRNELSGFAIRFYDYNGDGDYTGCGRAWVVPYRDGHQAGYVCFNAYGISLELVSQVLAWHFKMPHSRKIYLEANGQTTSLLYINHGRGIYISPTPIDNSMDYINLIYDEPFTCYACDCSISGDDVYTGADDNIYCEDCFCEVFTYCDHCGQVMYRDNAVSIDDNTYCDYCFTNRLSGHYCDFCGQPGWESDMVEDNGKWYCQECWEDNAQECDCCGEFHFDLNLNKVKDCNEELCENCVSDMLDEGKLYRCDCCHYVAYPNNMVKLIPQEDGYTIRYLCTACAAAYEYWYGSQYSYIPLSDSDKVCDCCGEFGRKEDMVESGGKWYCQSCWEDAKPCEGCGIVQPWLTIINDHQYCEACVDKLVDNNNEPYFCDHCRCVCTTDQTTTMIDHQTGYHYRFCRRCAGAYKTYYPDRFDYVLDNQDNPVILACPDESGKVIPILHLSDIDSIA